MTTEETAPDAPVDDTEEHTDAVAEAEAEVEEGVAEDLSESRDDDSELVKRLRAEARKYRQRLRDEEGRANGLQAQLDRSHLTLETYDRREAERIASEEGMLHPEDLWNTAQIADFRSEASEDGVAPLVVVESKVKDALRRLRSDRPTWFKQPFRHGPGLAYVGPEESTFGQALNRAGAAGRRR